MKIRQNKMLGYLAVTAGAGCAASVANAAVVFYGNASNTNIQADPAGINIGLWAAGIRALDSTYSSGSFFGGAYGFTRGTDRSFSSSSRHGMYFAPNRGGLTYGAVSGDQNFASISFNGDDKVYEAVAQFYFDGLGGGYLMAIATTNAIPNPQDLSAVGGPALSISAGKAMIDAAAVPEPTSLGLLALGAMGLAASRQRRKAA